MALFFIFISHRILQKKRDRINIIFSGFFISSLLAFIFNMIYAPIDIEHEELIIILHFLSWFFLSLGLVFVLIVNIIILKPTLIFSIKRQNIYIICYGLMIFFGMLILIIISDVIPESLDIIGIEITPSGRPGWKPFFFIYLTSIITIFAIIPTLYTSIKIYNEFENPILKKKWFYYIIGLVGLFTFNLYPSLMLNLLTGIMEKNRLLDILQITISSIGITVIIWASLMYHGLSSKLKEQKNKITVKSLLKKDLVKNEY